MSNFNKKHAFEIFYHCLIKKKKCLDPMAYSHYPVRIKLRSHAEDNPLRPILFLFFTPLKLLLPHILEACVLLLSLRVDP
jgi:hypothetical protein